MEIKDLKTLIKMVTETDITEFEMENAEEKILIKRGKGQEVIHVSAPAAPQYMQPAPVGTPAPAPVAPAAAAPAETAKPVSDKYETITSPIVGTLYRAPAPDADPYVEVGTVVDKGQVFCIVEAMKLMNEIEAEFKCKVVEILKENAQPVEFGDALFLVERL
ncbi:acetyl-CoA carboxylase biotin carboxyl carrier protein [Geoalkalibacter halelectricus]|uniref:Biotin carboxyl carrier protein of acetyl-CoA carboxylase n=1 Tax=Geoalkalibacter halelectricus TaxID=2847045 RepID=A0ABY5ZVR6_9BACT|nr:acetyl-CoA carboxylase biotin carboxyl carrier protein [Geoalkalibacter halelectricus]MDO3376758.1 acetyl-CoA carboxylase biotin carboxyl carrier protein [Geoalkalibacter halelectricus]UWZ81291.1 acetyl-CoA carboxylase biotin carboxyl carrier protein [Geoalkalibacter halelectricus]